MYRRPGSKEGPATFLFARGHWTAPALALPSPGKAVVAVRFCPVLFERDDNGGGDAPGGPSAPGKGKGEGQGEVSGAAAPAWPFALPYKMVFAAATLDSVVLYDTQSPQPLALLGHLHYDSITDLAWSSDGAFLAVSSRDCYCSIAAFEPGELGRPADPGSLPPHVARRVAAAQRRAEPLTAPCPAAAQPGRPAGKSAAALQTAGAAQAGQPVAAAAAATAGTLTAVAAVPSGQKRRIKAEPISSAPPPWPSTAAAAAGEQQQPPSAKRAKHVVPEPVGERPAAAQAPRRIHPEQVGAPPAAAAPEAGAAPAAAVPKLPKRITPQLVAPGGDGCAAGCVGPAESAFSGAAAAPSAGGRRITPTRLGVEEEVSEKFGHAAEAPARSGSAAAGRSSAAPCSHRRIKPVPVGASPQPLPGAAEERAAPPPPSGGLPPAQAPIPATSSRPSTAGKAGGKLGIAALAALAGKQAAEQSHK